MLVSRASAPSLYGGFWLRLLAWLVDSMLLSIALALAALVGLASGALAPLGSPAGQGTAFGLAGLALVLHWLYGAAMESSARRATLGKLVVGLRVVDVGGAQLSFGRASARTLGKLLSALALGGGFVLVGLTARKQGLHDLLSRTCVVRAA